MTIQLIFAARFCDYSTTKTNKLVHTSLFIFLETTHHEE